jgi:4-amino-4-deoxy-L-arabinose transferase-like glycosyltransferase
LLLLALFLAAFLRFWQLGDVPAGLYRDEAYNGLDAVQVLSGQWPSPSPLYFPANNGREPLYIYLTAAAVALVGQTALAVRLGAAVVGTLTTAATYLLAKEWFGHRVGLLSALIWAFTIWPVHLSRIGLRAIMLPLVLSLALWLGTLAYRRSVAGRPARGLWLAAGLVYGLCFYTYLAAWVTPLVIGAIVVYLWFRGRRPGLWPGLAYGVLGLAAAGSPLLYLLLQQPALMVGRSGQVSILNPAVRDGSLPGALWRNLWQALGMFFVRGDTIVRHNVAGRAVFDPLMAVPFLAGVTWCWRHRRLAAAAALLAWVGLMLVPTIVADDAPHFLRAVGILPGLLFMPALGLSLLWSWSKLPRSLRQFLVVATMLVSLVLGVRDYFLVYGQQPDNGYWFDAAARDLAENINRSEEGTRVYLDSRFWDGWPTVRYLVAPDRAVIRYDTDAGPPAPIRAPAAVLAWPYSQPEAVVAAISSDTMVTAYQGSLAQGDFEREAYPLYVHYAVEGPPALDALARFGASIYLERATLEEVAEGEVLVELYWRAEETPDEMLASFVHVVGPGGIVAQSDHLPGEGYLVTPWWQPGLVIHDSHRLDLDEGADSEERRILVGLYDVDTGHRLPVVDLNNELTGDAWLWPPR